MGRTTDAKRPRQGEEAGGETTVGKLLADELGLEFLDSDKEIEDRTGADIGWIFDVEGETGFRKREAAMIDELTALGAPDELLEATRAARADEVRHTASMGNIYNVLSPAGWQYLLDEAKKRDMDTSTMRWIEPQPPDVSV